MATKMWKRTQSIEPGCPPFRHLHKTLGDCHHANKDSLGMERLPIMISLLTNVIICSLENSNYFPKIKYQYYMV